MAQILPPLLQARLEQLPRGLQDHIRRIRRVGVELAGLHGVDLELTDLACAAHDIARSLKGEALLKEARRLGLSVHPVEERLPILLHGPVAARWMELEIGIGDSQVLQAVHYHSTAAANLCALAKVVFLADKLDPQKIKERPHLERIRDLAWKNLDQAMLEFINQELAGFVQKGGLIHPATIEARNELLLFA